MAEFCKDCSIRVFDKDFKELAGQCKEDEFVWALCEGCGWIMVDSDGKRWIPEEKNSGQKDL